MSPYLITRGWADAWCPTCDTSYPYKVGGRRTCPKCAKAGKAANRSGREPKAGRSHKEPAPRFVVESDPPRPALLDPIPAPTFRWPATPGHRPVKTTYCNLCGHVYSFVLPPRREPPCPKCRKSIDMRMRAVWCDPADEWPGFERINEAERRALLTPLAGQCPRCFEPDALARCIECELDDEFVAHWPKVGPVRVRVLA